MFGITNIKAMIAVALGFSRELMNTFQDGKFQMSELFNFIDDFAKIPEVVKNWPKIKEELADLTKPERDELIAYFVTEFDIPNDKVEAFIEKAIQNAGSLLDLVEMWRDLKKTA